MFSPYNQPIVEIRKPDLICPPNKPTGLKLYHGTSAAHVPSIAKCGLLPRSQTPIDNYSRQGLPSMPQHVYLATKEFIYYALAASLGESEQYQLAIIEIDLDALDFSSMLPNEDSLYEVLLRGRNPLMTRLTSVADQVEYAKRCVYANKGLWFDYLVNRFTVAHAGAIPIGAVSRIAVFEQNSFLFDLFCSKQLQAYKSGEIYDPLNDSSYDVVCRWLFGAGLTQEDLELMAKDALSKGYRLANRQFWPSDLLNTGNRRPFVVWPNTMTLQDEQTLADLARPLT